MQKFTRSTFLQLFIIIIQNLKFKISGLALHIYTLGSVQKFDSFIKKTAFLWLQQTWNHSKSDFVFEKMVAQTK